MPLRESHVRKAESLFRSTLRPQRLEEIARGVGLVKRRRLVSATSLFWALIVGLGAQSSEFISDILRTLNAREGLSVRYKPFWNRLAQSAFPAFMKMTFEVLCQELVQQTLRRERGSAAGFFSDIFIDDGSSFAVADGLSAKLPSRFTKKRPAGVELHARISLKFDNVVSVTLAPDKEAERQFLPEPHELPTRSLSLRDRGYIDLAYFEALQEHNAFLICRSGRAINPIVEKVRGVSHQRAKRWRGKRLNDLPMTKLRGGAELTVLFTRKRRVPLRLRLVIRYLGKPKKKQNDKRKRWSEKNAWLFLLTNVPHEIGTDEIVDLYRLRWQIELTFKEWKSYAGLREFQTENVHIVEGLIWASLCAAFIKRMLAHFAQTTCGNPISTRITAQVGLHILLPLAEMLQRGRGCARLRRILVFLGANAVRAMPARQKRRPQHRLGLRDVGIA